MRASERECHGVDGALPCRLGTTARIPCGPRGDVGERLCRCSSARCNPQRCRGWLVAGEAAHWCNSSSFSRQALFGSREFSAVREASRRITACTNRTAPGAPARASVPVSCSGDGSQLPLLLLLGASHGLPASSEPIPALEAKF